LTIINQSEFGKRIVVPVNALEKLTTNSVYFTILPENEIRLNIPSIHSWVSSFPLLPN